MRIIIAATAGLALLTACSDGGAEADAGADGDVAVAEEDAVVDAAADDAVQLRAGQWENTIEFTEFDVPGVPQSMKDMLARQMGQSITTKACITQDQAEKPDAGFFGGEKNENCTYDTFDRTGNNLSLRMTCRCACFLGERFASTSFDMVPGPGLRPWRRRWSCGITCWNGRPGARG